ncbi:IS66 family insertion sequence element accessory protein TnpA [Chitinophaga agri]|uniref:Transposase n=1 Tax=Chitinophaga agri TaxID=2703787 RepID=A0A6B9Z930_9BACT|nr:hypothetical protein [Chitinophaga agri]QHS58379.1 hypothetical protein GWR21_01855 [Chitinophaga agri]
MQPINNSTIRSFTISEKKNIAMQWSQSNVKMQVFCDNHGITVSMLKNWRKQFATPAKVPRRKHFIQLTPSKASIPDIALPFAEVISLSGNRIIFHSAVNTDMLKELLNSK